MTLASSTGPAAAHGLARRGSSAAPRLAAVRAVLLVAILLLAWISVNPFPSLAELKLIELGDTSDLINQIAYVGIAACVAAYLLAYDPQALRPLLRPVYVATMMWFLVSVAVSDYPALSTRRLVFDASVILLAAAVPVLPTNLRRFCGVTASVVLAVIGLCFAGVLLFPELAIHQPDDVVEPLLAGAWRGLFPHKNIAGSMMALFVFVGLFIAKARSLALGLSIVTAAATFLIFSEAKAALLLIPLVLALSFACMRTRSFGARVVVILAVLVGLSIVTLGSLYFPAIRAIDAALLPDPTFTGRVDIWQYAIDNIQDRPVFGHGFGAFWETEETYHALALNTDGLGAVSHAHNAFLDLALTTGIPGLLLGFLWIAVLPIKDVQQAIEAGADPALTELFLRIWLFGLYICSFENVLFGRGNPVWFTMLVAMFGMRYLSMRSLVR